MISINHILHPKAKLKKVTMIFDRLFIAILKCTTYQMRHLIETFCVESISWIEHRFKRRQFSALINSLNNTNLTIITCKFLRNLLFHLKSLSS